MSRTLAQIFIPPALAGRVTHYGWRNGAVLSLNGDQVITEVCHTTRGVVSSRITQPGESTARPHLPREWGPQCRVARYNAGLRTIGLAPVRSLP